MFTMKNILIGKEKLLRDVTIQLDYYAKFFKGTQKHEMLKYQIGSIQEILKNFDKSR